MCRDILQCNKSVVELEFAIDGKFDHACDCGKRFESKQGLHQHLLVCDYTVENRLKQIEDENGKLKALINHESIGTCLELQAALKAAQQQIQAMQAEIDSSKLDLRYYKKKRDEPFYQMLLEPILSGTHKKLPCGITDITTDDTHVEIKEWRCWKEAVGQLTCYNEDDPKPYLAIYLFGKYGDKCKHNAIRICTARGFKMYDLVDTDYGVDIIDCASNECLYQYKPKHDDHQ